jgi:hypothetical protein
MPKQISTATLEGKEKVRRLRKRQRDEIEENFNTMAIKHRQAMERDCRG